MRLLVGFVIFGLSASGQDMMLPKDSSVVRAVDELPSHEPFDTSRSYRKVEQQYVYIISDKDLYEIFGYEVSVKYRDFNFKDYHILGQEVNKKWIWEQRENRKALIEISSITKFGSVGIKLPDGAISYLADTIMKSINDTAQWYTHGHGDCKAHFKYVVAKDKYYPVVLLIERNYWGGCRAGGSKAYTISFVMPKNILQYSKNTILMDKYRAQPDD